MRFVLYIFAIAGSFILIGCDQDEANVQTESRTLTNKLEQIRLHFAGFTKSKSGAT